MKNSTIGDLQPITLPEPVFERCGTVFEALKMRRTSRAISDKKIPLADSVGYPLGCTGSQPPPGTFWRPGPDCGIGE